MKLLIRYIQGSEIKESQFSGNELSIGRGTDQVVQILDPRLALAHTTMELSAGKLTTKASSGQSFNINDKRARSGNLVAGDSLDISGHVITVIQGSGDNDFILEVVVGDQTSDQLRDRYNTRLKELNINVRAYSWAFGILIILAGLFIPALGAFNNDLLPTVRSIPLASDSDWLSGSLHPAHKFMGDDCQLCHAIPFQQTRDQECVACHDTWNHHYDTEKFPLELVNDGQCADCHKEHSGRDALVRSDQTLCVDCHATNDGIGGSERLRNVSDFETDHPQLKLSILTPVKDNNDYNWISERRVVSDPNLSENSHLIFPHDEHLSADGIDAPEGSRVLQCETCHVVEKGGSRMQPITMEANCAECHELTFDLDDPQRVVPHGNAMEVVTMLQEYYANKYNTVAKDSRGNPRANIATANGRDGRRPGRSAPLRRNPRNTPMPSFGNQKVGASEFGSKAMAWSQAKAMEAAEDIFERQTCTICHEVDKTPNAEIPWRVKPVRLTKEWLPLARFNHDGHLNMACQDCHKAETSDDAHDVLMPDIANCRGCHGGEDSTGLLQSACIECHDFHLPNQARMNPAALQANQLEGKTNIMSRYLGGGNK